MYDIRLILYVGCVEGVWSRQLQINIDTIMLLFLLSHILRVYSKAILMLLFSTLQMQ